MDLFHDKRGGGALHGVVHCGAEYLTKFKGSIKNLSR